MPGQQLELQPTKINTITFNQFTNSKNKKHNLSGNSNVNSKDKVINISFNSGNSTKPIRNSQFLTTSKQLKIEKMSSDNIHESLVIKRLKYSSLERIDENGQQKLFKTESDDRKP